MKDGKIDNNMAHNMLSLTKYGKQIYFPYTYFATYLTIPF